MDPSRVARRRPPAAPVLLLALAACGGPGERPTADEDGPPGSESWILAREVPGGDAERGRAYTRDYGCGFCHVIPGVEGAHGAMGPPLADFARRRFVAGAVANEPSNLITWLVDPQAVQPGTAMPALGVTDAHARDMAAYLYTLGDESVVGPPEIVPLRWLMKLKGGEESGH